MRRRLQPDPNSYEALFGQETAESMRARDPINQRIDWLAGSVVERRRENARTATGIAIMALPATVAAAYTGGLGAGAAVGLFGEGTLGLHFLWVTNQFPKHKSGSFF